MVLAVSTVVPHYRLALRPASPPVILEPHVAIRPRGGLKMQVERVKTARPTVAEQPVPIGG
jgi:hypothetical protein